MPDLQRLEWLFGLLVHMQAENDHIMEIALPSNTI